MAVTIVPPVDAGFDRIWANQWVPDLTVPPSAATTQGTSAQTAHFDTLDFAGSVADEYAYAWWTVPRGFNKDATTGGLDYRIGAVATAATVSSTTGWVPAVSSVVIADNGASNVAYTDHYPATEYDTSNTAEDLMLTAWTSIANYTTFDDTEVIPLRIWRDISAETGALGDVRYMFIDLRYNLGV